MSEKKRLIVLEGLDGSGKSTQFEIIDRYLTNNNIEHAAISFPDYDKPSSALVKMYLSGEFSKNADDVNAYAASSFYAVDRFASFKLYWEERYNRGDIIISGRYTTSNAVYQMNKLDRSKWDSYLEWLEDYEYSKLGLPRPDLVVFLDMPIEVSQKLMTGRYGGDEGKKDIHERNLNFLNKCREAALYTAKKLNWTVIECSDGNSPLPIETITKKIIAKIEDIC